MAKNKVRQETNDSIRKSRTRRENNAALMPRKLGKSLKTKKNFCEVN